MTSSLISFVVTTVGGEREGNLTRLLDSLEAQHHKNFEVVVSYQGVGKLHLHKKYGFPLRIIYTTGGASRGRNFGALSTNPTSLFVTFPNDTTWYEPQFVSFLAEHSRYEAIVLETLESGNPRYSLRSKSGSFALHNVWAVLEPSVMIRRSTFIEYLGLDESLGTGTYSPWQNAAIADFLVRASKAISGVLWDSDSHLINGVGQNYGLSENQQKLKLSRYGVGYAFVRNRIGHGLLSNLCSVVYPLVSFRITSVPKKLSEFNGRLKGMIGAFLVGRHGYRSLQLLPVLNLEVRSRKLIVIETRALRGDDRKWFPTALEDRGLAHFECSDVFLITGGSEKPLLTGFLENRLAGVISFVSTPPGTIRFDLPSLLKLYEQVEVLSIGANRAIDSRTFSSSNFATDSPTLMQVGDKPPGDESFMVFENGSTKLVTIPGRIHVEPVAMLSGSILEGSHQKLGSFASLILGTRQSGTLAKAITFSVHLLREYGPTEAICYLRGAALSKMFPGYRI